MTGSVAIDVVIGLVFIYLLYSLLASLIQEIIATYLSFRAKILEKGIARMLQDEKPGTGWIADRFKSWAHVLFRKNIFEKGSLAEKFYQHPLIKYLGEDKWYGRPSYLKAGNFSKVIVDLIRGPIKSLDEDLRAKIESVLMNDAPHDHTNTGDTSASQNLTINGETKKFLKSLWADAQGDIQKFKALLENWFDETMERTTGWYKRYNQMCLLIVGLVIAVAFNVDTIQIVQKLSRDPELRAQLVQQADAYIKDHPRLKEDLAAQKKRIDELLGKNSTEVDSAKVEDEKKSLDSVYQEKVQRLDSLQKAIDSLVKKDIKNVTELLALGWGKTCKKVGDCEECTFGPRGFTIYSIFGWILTALALSMGAPFWFDLLNKLMKLRSTVQTTSESEAKNEESKINRVG